MEILLPLSFVTDKSFDNSDGVVGELLENEVIIMKEIENDNVVKLRIAFNKKTLPM